MEREGQGGGNQMREAVMESASYIFFLDSSGGDGEINTRTQQTWVAAYAWISTSVKTLVKDIQS